MCRQIRYVLLILILDLSVVALGAVTPKDVLGAVRALSWTNHDVDQENGPPRRAVYCTVFAVGPHQWVTAGHCIHGKQDYEVGEDARGGVPVTVIFVDAERDLAGLVDRSNYRHGVLTLALREPQIDDDVVTAGYPYGLIKILASGHVMTMAVHMRSPHETEQWYTYMNLSFCPGQSGSPVVTRGGLLVGVLQTFLASPCASVAGVAPWGELSHFLDEFKALSSW